MRLDRPVEKEYVTPCRTPTMTNNGDDVMKLISRAEAISAGLGYYFTGKPCKRGHVDERRVDNWSCITCERDRRRKYCQDNPQKVKEQNKRRFQDKARRERILKAQRRYQAGRREEARKSWSEYYEKNRESLIAKNREYQKANPEKVRAWAAARRATPEGKAADFMRRCITRHLVGKKTRRTHELLGYSSDELRAHIERQFSKGMTWDNYGDWHVDHITPVSQHIKDGETDPAVINCLTNLRPIWASENFRKSARRTHLL